MNPEHEEILDAVSSINDDICEQCENEEAFLSLFIHTDGFCANVMWLDNPIWCSENDERIADEETGEYEPIEGFLRIQVKELLEKLSHIKIL
jgi:hypothetical protein